MNLAIKLQPKQHELWELCERGTASWLGYGGARGGGKSAAARRIMLLRRLQYPGTWGMIFRRVWEDVRINHVDKFFAEFPDFKQFYSESKHELTLPNNSKILFGYAETLADVKRKFHGPEYMDIFVDQAEQLTEQELRQIKMACRWPNMPEGKCKLVLFFNPGGVGVAFLKRIFHDRKYKENEKADDYTFLQAYGWDNEQWIMPALQTDGLVSKDFYHWDSEARFKYFIERSDYGRELNALPQTLRVGHLLGSFESFAGQYFAEVFDRDRQVIPHDNAEALIRPWWSRWISIDWGFAHYSAIMWHAKGVASPEELKKLLGLEADRPEDVVLTYRELVVNETAEGDLANLIVNMTPPNERQQIRKIFLSPDAFAKRGSANTIAEQLGDIFLRDGLPRPYPADNDRVGGWRLCYNLLKGTA